MEIIAICTGAYSASGKDPLAIAMAKKQLEDALLFSDCFCPGYHKGFTDNVEGVLFSNQHRLIKLFDSVFSYTVNNP